MPKNIGAGVGIVLVAVAVTSCDVSTGGDSPMASSAIGGTTVSCREGVRAVIDLTAVRLGVDRRLAEAIASVESGQRSDAVGDRGHSVGLYQLNDRGEGAGMSVASREDAGLNASIALSRVAMVRRQFPGADPGRVAALAQRPARPVAYARMVDAKLASDDAPPAGCTPLTF